MKKVIVILCFVVLTTLGFAGDEKGEAALDANMKAAGKNMGGLRKAVEAKNKADIIAQAKDMEKIFKQSEKFFSKRKNADAVKWSVEAKAAAKELAAAAKKGEDEKITSSMKALGGTCAACHGVYREKLPDGSYKLKS